MPKYPVAEAAKRARIERTTLYRKISKGDISCEKDDSGNKVIDASELTRVYPNADISVNDATVDQQLQKPEIQQRATTNFNNDNKLLQREVEVRDEKILELEHKLEQLRADKDDVIGDLRKRLDAESEERRKLTAMLTDQRQKEDRGLWSRLFGKG